MHFGETWLVVSIEQIQQLAFGPHLEPMVSAHLPAVVEADQVVVQFVSVLAVVSEQKRVLVKSDACRVCTMFDLVV